MAYFKTTTHMLDFLIIIGNVYCLFKNKFLCMRQLSLKYNHNKSYITFTYMIYINK